MQDLIGTKLGQYTITSLLGTGGMAAVYRARQESVKRDVAIKVIQSTLANDPDFIRRFEREAETVAQISHPHILKVFDFGEQGGLLYIVMELLPGGSLADLLARGNLPVDRIVKLFEQIASALDYAHTLGIVHRDLKPQNVLLDAQGNAILTDFGVAKLLTTNATQLTQTGTVMGTPSYMSPEQWQGLPLDARSDIYAFGVMLFEILAGQPPFSAETPIGMMFQHVQQAPPLISTVNPRINPRVEPVLQRAMAKNPDDRYQSAQAMINDLKEAIGQPVNRSSTTGTALPRTDSGDYAKVAVPTGQSPARTVNVPVMPPRRSSRLPLIVAAVAVLAMLGIGGFALLSQQSQSSSTPTAIAVINTDTPTITLTTPSTATYTAIPTDTATATIDVEATINAAFTATNQAISTQSAFQVILDTTSTQAQLSTSLAISTATANAVASFTKTYTPTRTFTATATHTQTPTATLTASSTFTSTPTLTFTPSATLTPTLTATWTPTATNTPTPAPGTTNVINGIRVVYVTPSCFLMGSDPADDPLALPSEQPRHQVCITRGFWIGQYEITHTEYQRFLDSGGYDDQQYWSVDGWKWRTDTAHSAPVHYDGFDGPNQPRVGITFYESEAFAAWIGGRLPTEAEWEYAARGPLPGYPLYPWGNEYDVTKLNAQKQMDRTSDVGSYPAGVSWCGAYDMLGNVWEWVSDWFDPDYYKLLIPQDPIGAASGVGRGLRGGSWIDDSPSVFRIPFRGAGGVSDERMVVGMRIVFDASAAN